MHLNGTVLTVTVSARGLLDSSHAMHIHAGARGVCPPASAARRHNGHLAISTLDGAPFYGPPVTALTTKGDTSPRSILAFNRFPTGRVSSADTGRSSSAMSSRRTSARTTRSSSCTASITTTTGRHGDALDRSDLDLARCPARSPPPHCARQIVAAPPSSTSNGPTKSGQVVPELGQGHHVPRSLQAERPAVAALCLLGAREGDRTRAGTPDGGRDRRCRDRRGARRGERSHSLVDDAAPRTALRDAATPSVRVVKTRLGRILVNGEGRTLYLRRIEGRRAPAVAGAHRCGHRPRCPACPPPGRASRPPG